MTDKLTLTARVNYGDVDRTEVMLLPRIFKLLQEAAIAHANQFGTGTHAMATRGESWVLNRIAVSIERYPRMDEALRVETWSTGIKGFKGFREFRLFDAAEQPILFASSLWLYISTRTKLIVRLPREVAEGFPVRPEGPWCPLLEKLPFEPPAATAPAVPLTLRYSDFDVNEHVNNAAYLDFIQTAVSRAGRTPHPRGVRLKFAKAIPAESERVAVRVEPLGAGTRFSVESDDAVFALGETED
jgi:acyl-ACP thioesterase